MNNLLISKVKETILKFALIQPRDKVLLCVSGGPDSIAMLYAFNEIKDELDFEIAVATFDHGLREESTKEIAFVKNIALKFKIDFYSKREDISYISKKESKSIEDAARDARFKFFFDIKDSISFSKIALAHTLDDQVETILLHLIKGSGASGLVGIRPMSFDGIIHPMINIEKAEILKFLKENNIKYVIDKTNMLLDYERNKVRLQLLPLIESINPAFKKNVISTSKILASEDEFIELIAKKDLEFIKNDDSYSKTIFKRLPLFEQRRILKTLFGKESNFGIVERAIAFLGSKQRKFNVNKETYLICDGKFFWFEKNAPFSIEKEIEIEIPGMARIEESDIEISAEILDVSIKKLDRLNVAFSFDKLKLPLKIRFRKEGDVIYTETGRKKVQDIFIDNKVKRDERYKIPIVVDREGEILWIVGIRRSSHYKIVNETSNTLFLSASFNKK
jgi:tRNA(Ile)-lysidine synthase